MTKARRYSGHNLAQRLFDSLPKRWDGMQCILELKTVDYNWRQMEWIGWWFEYKAKEVLSALGARPGSAFGSVTFDCFLDGVWDFKSHPDGKSKWAYLNDEDAHGHLGWLIAIGDAEYDDSGAFKTWHDALKGSPSSYVRRGNAIGRKSRKRKIAFNLRSIIWIEFRSAAEIRVALNAGWMCRGMQAGQRNSNGAPRNPKYGFSLTRWRSYLGPLKGGAYPS